MSKNQRKSDKILPKYFKKRVDSIEKNIIKFSQNCQVTRPRFESDL